MNSIRKGWARLDLVEQSLLMIFLLGALLAGLLFFAAFQPVDYFEQFDQVFQYCMTTDLYSREECIRIAGAILEARY